MNQDTHQFKVNFYELTMGQVIFILELEDDFDAKDHIRGHTIIRNVQS